MADVQVCVNCLMTQGKARRLENIGGVWECVTIGGCGGRFTDGYLSKVSRQVHRMMEAFGMDTSQIIVRGGKLERQREIQQGERQVILPDDDEPSE